WRTGARAPARRNQFARVIVWRVAARSRAHGCELSKRDRSTVWRACRPRGADVSRRVGRAGEAIAHRARERSLLELRHVEVGGLTRTDEREARVLLLLCAPAA